MTASSKPCWNKKSRMILCESGLDIAKIGVYTPNHGRRNASTGYNGIERVRRSMYLLAHSQSGACNNTILRYVFAAEWITHDPVYRAGGDRTVRTRNGDAPGGDVSHGSKCACTRVETA